MKPEILTQLQNYIARNRETHKDQPFLSDFENGVNFGANDKLDEIELILKGDWLHDK